MQRSIRRNTLRYLLMFVIFAFLGSVFILSLKDDNENGRKLRIPSVVVAGKSYNNFPRIPEGASREDVNSDWKAKHPKEFTAEHGEEDKHLGRQSEGTIKENSVHESNRPPVDVYIFEEHHEALPYWFGAAYNGTIPKTGNTLIHIDGHSDLAPPNYFPGYPFFRWPAKDQVKLLMQRNDAFIQSAIMAGLITRMIWVWPEWDRQNHQKDHAVFTVKLGWALANRSDSSLLETVFCMCQQTEDKIDCMHPQDRDENGDEEVLIDPEQCHVKKVVTIEEVNEFEAISFFKRKDWIDESENVILDIDEDFFGCSYVIKPLLDTNISVDSVRLIEQNLRKLVCPKSTFHETKTNEIILQVVSLLILQKSCQMGLQKAEKCKDSSVNHRPDKFLTILLTKAHSMNETNICTDRRTRAKFQTFAERFVIGLSKLTVEQLKLIHGIGFCATTTPKTLEIYGQPEFGLCYGANTPLESAVTEFNPDSKDIKKRSLTLRNIIENSKQYSPKLVTLCRSMRDGYTPRQYFSTIENEILTHLEDIYTNINLHFDKDLLDGRTGRLTNQEI